MGKRAERQNQLLAILKKQRAASVKRLASALSVSEMTIRRDLHELEEDKAVELFHGGAIYKPGNSNSPEIIARTNLRYQLNTEDMKNAAAKQRIGMRAAKLVEPDDIIIIDSGSTTIHLAEQISNEISFTAIFWALNILEAVRQKPLCSMIFAGGYYHENTMMFESSDGVELIRRNRANKGFFAAGGVNARLGVTNSNPYAVDIKQSSIASSLTKILMVDSSKFGDIKPAYYARLEDFDIVITDEEIPQEYVHIVEDLGIKLYTV
jgi:DeoR family deoxyribose operon repressor